MVFIVFIVCTPIGVHCLTTHHLKGSSLALSCQILERLFWKINWRSVRLEEAHTTAFGHDQINPISLACSVGAENKRL